MLRLQSSLPISAILCVLCCGCPAPDEPITGGDPPVAQKDTIEGTAEILTVTDDVDGDRAISFKWTASYGPQREQPVENLKLSELKGLPEDFEAMVGDKLALSVYIEFKRRMSVGPPDTWASHDKREITYLSDGLSVISAE